MDAEQIAILIRAARMLAFTRWGFWGRGIRPSPGVLNLAERGLVSIDRHTDRDRHFVSITAAGLVLLARHHPAADPCLPTPAGLAGGGGRGRTD